ncbi:MAG TPA: hypothetical protein VKB26_02725 [Candidatus Acidoferrales bacterium]|nr:hypothetical protein [Candidatus Acidoferrales bacterium]
MSSGFNSDVSVGNDVFHVQTEEYGEPQFNIVTLVYHGGRILHRRNSSYSDFAATPEYSEDALGERVEDQHRSVIEEVRIGTISIPPSARADTDESHGIRVRLLNANSWLVAGQATLDLQVLRRSDDAPIRDAQIEAYLSGPLEKTHFKARTGPDGLAQVRFAVPNSASHGAELVIRADAGASEAIDEIRFVLRAKSKSGAPKAER